MESHGEIRQPASLLFPGYNSLHQGLLKNIYEQSRIVQEYVEQAEHITQLPIQKILFNGSKTEIMLLPDAYALLFLVQASITDYVRSPETPIMLVGGYGMGMYGALFAAGCISFPDGLYIVSKWATMYNDFLQARNVKNILIRGLNHAQLKKILSRHKNGNAIEISEKIADDAYYIAGMRSTVELIEEELVEESSDVTVEEVPSEGGLYAYWMEEYLYSFRQYVEKVSVHGPRVPCVSGTNASLTSAQDVKDFIGNQPFLFQDRAKLIQQYSHAETIIIPCSYGQIFEQVHAYYPQKHIVTIS